VALELPRDLTAALPLASYKIRIQDRHVRAVPRVGLDGAPFEGPGVDLRGVDAALAIRAAQPLIAWLDAREPGVQVRSISVRTDGPRVLISLEPRGTGDPRPRAMRFDPPYANELRDAASEAERVIGEASARVLARRSATSG
jgi:hypothetical protein